MQPGKRLVGKVAIVTGGASGIGAETARLFAQHGASVVLTDSNASLGKTVEKEISDAAGTAMFATQDVRDEAQWATIVAQAEKTYGRLDILCNIAGISGRDPKMNIQTSLTAGPRLAEQTLEQWNRVMEINATGVFLGTKAAIPALLRAGGGSIVNISSICGIVGSHANAAYHASKGAVRIFSKAAAIQYAPDKIRVNSVHPGFVDTPMTKPGHSNPEVARTAPGGDPARPLRNAGRYRRRLPLPCLGRGIVGHRQRARDRRRHDRELKTLQSRFIDVTAPGVAVRPPSITKCAPVMLPAKSEHRKSTVLATSSAVP